MFQALVHDSGNVIICQGIVDRLSVPAEFDQGALFENPQLM